VIAIAIELSPLVARFLRSWESVRIDPFGGSLQSAGGDRKVHSAKGNRIAAPQETLRESNGSHLVDGL
jgi:hypothetical protein